jgi:hypothetical protein
MLAFGRNENGVRIPSPEEMPQSPGNPEPRSIPREWKNVEWRDFPGRYWIRTTDFFRHRCNL